MVKNTSTKTPRPTFRQSWVHSRTKGYTFSHDGRVYSTVGDQYETAYYSRDKRKYRRRKLLGHQHWENTSEETIDDDQFYMIIACIERRPRYASH